MWLVAQIEHIRSQHESFFDATSSHPLHNGQIWDEQWEELCQEPRTQYICATFPLCLSNTLALVASKKVALSLIVRLGCFVRMEHTKVAADWILRSTIDMAQRLVPFTPSPVYPEPSQAWITPSQEVYKPVHGKQPLFPDVRRMLVNLPSANYPQSDNYHGCGHPIVIPTTVVRSALSSLSSDDGSLPVSPQDRVGNHSGRWVHLGGLADEETGDSPEYVFESFRDISLGEPLVQKDIAAPFHCDTLPSVCASHADQVEEHDVTERPFASFTWVRALGEGGYAAAVAVREAREGVQYTFRKDETKGRLLCLKVFVKSVMLKRDLLHGVHRELLAYRTLTFAGKVEGSAFIMELDGSLQDDHRVYFAMELMKYDLMAVLTEGKPGKEENKTRWIAQIAAGLDALHGLGIIHRDIKPENLMIDYRDNIRISDFGASYVNAERERLHAAGRYTDEVLGTWPYTAPEVMDTRGKPKHSRRGYGTAVDYWALGCIVFELESPGSPLLFETEADLDLYRRWQPEKSRERSFIAAMKFPSVVDSLILGLIHLDPLRRFDTNDLRRHPYFRRSDGTTEFDDIEARALSRPSCEPDEGKDEIGDMDPRLVFRPVFRRPGGGCVEKSSFDNLCWINPEGIWAPGWW